MTNRVRKEAVNTLLESHDMNRAAIRRHKYPNTHAKPHGICALLYGLLVLILLSGLPIKGHAAEEIVLVTYGDSLSAGFGLSEAQSFPVQLEAALKKRGHKVRVVNVSVSGDTTAAGLKRFDWSFPAGADGAILELGANDAMRGLDPQNARANLDEILKRMKAKGVEPLLTGMLAPRNLGVEYSTAFDGIYAKLAKKHGILLYPFFLFDVVGKRDLSLEDGLHPNQKGVARIVEQIVPVVEKLLARIAARRQ